MTNEPPESPAPVMDGPGRRAEGRARDGGPHQDKCFLLLEPGQAGGGTGDLGRRIYETSGQRGGGARDRDRKAETQGPGAGAEREVGTQRLRQRSPETELGVGETKKGKGEIESKSENEGEMETETYTYTEKLRDYTEKERHTERKKTEGETHGTDRNLRQKQTQTTPRLGPLIPHP